MIPQSVIADLFEDADQDDIDMLSVALAACGACRSAQRAASFVSSLTSLRDACGLAEAWLRLSLNDAADVGDRRVIVETLRLDRRGAALLRRLRVYAAVLEASR